MTEDFIKDDHDHDVSVSSLSVQIFTVPSLVGLLLKKCVTMTTFCVFFTPPVEGGFSLAAILSLAPWNFFCLFFLAELLMTNCKSLCLNLKTSSKHGIHAV